MTAIFAVPDIECDGCAVSIQKALGRQPGVEDVGVDVPAKTVRVEFAEGETSPARLAEALAEIGFPPSLG